MEFCSSLSNSIIMFNRNDIVKERGKGNRGRFILSENLKNVFNHIEQTEQLPVIFAGSGITKRYTSSKYDWKQLLVNCISVYSDNPESKYKQYETKVKYEMNSRSSSANSKFSINEAIGSEIEYDFNMAYYEEKISGLKVPEDGNPLKFYISKLLCSYTLDQSMIEEINLLMKLESKMLTVVTTNYDNFFEEHVFKKHEKIVGQDVFSKSEIGTLFKIHGCVTNPNSIVITEKDYDTFKRKRKILSAKLISLFTENPVIFMGYSIHDENIKDILTDIFMCLDSDEEIKALENRLILINYDENVGEPIVGNHSLDVGNSIFINLTKITLSSYLPLLKEMQQLKRTIKFKEIRLIQDLIFEVVHSDEGANKKLVNLLGGDETDDNDVVIAITKKDHVLSDFGIIGITRDDLFDDLIQNGDKFNDVSLNLLIEQHLPNLLNGSVALPVHKYLYKANISDVKLANVVAELKEKEPESYLNSTIKKLKAEYLNSAPSSFEEILTLDLSFYKKTAYLVLHSIDCENEEEIRLCLQKYEKLIREGSGGATTIRKMACIYDIRKYKAPSEDSAS